MFLFGLKEVFRSEDFYLFEFVVFGNFGRLKEGKVFVNRLLKPKKKLSSEWQSRGIRFAIQQGYSIN